MPITENSFTADELKSALSTNKDALLPIVKGVLGNDFKFVVQDETEHNSFKQNFETQLISSKTKEWADKLEADVKELTGLDKADANEKYYDYFKRATKQKLESVTALETELAALKDKHNPSAADKARIKQLEDGIQEKETTYKKQLQEKDALIHKLTVGNELGSVMAKIRATYKADLPASVVEIVERTILEKLTASAKFQEDNVLTFLDDKGEVILNKATYKPETAETLLKEALKDLIDTGRQQGGAGSGAQGGQGGKTGNEGGAGAITAIPADIKSRVQWTDYLLKQGITQGSKEWNDAMALADTAKLPLR